MTEPKNNNQQSEHVGEVNPETVPFEYKFGSDGETRRRTSFHHLFLYMTVLLMIRKHALIDIL